MSYFDFYRRKFRSSVPQNGAIVIPPKVYVLNTGSNNVSVIDKSLEAVIKTISLSASPSNMEITPDGKKIYITLGGSNKIDVIDTVTDTLLTTISSVAGFPIGIAVTPDSSRCTLLTC